MAAGEYVSMKVQREVFEQLIHKEAHEIATMPEEEERELAGIFEAKGIAPEMAASIAADVMKDPQIALETHAREELGIDMRAGLGSPWAAAASSFVMFAVGAAVPLLPFLFTAGRPAVVVSAVLSGCDPVRGRGRDDRAHRPRCPALGSADARDRCRCGRDHLRRRRPSSGSPSPKPPSVRVRGACRRSGARRGRSRPASSRTARRPRRRATTGRSPRSRSGCPPRPPSARSRTRAGR